MKSGSIQSKQAFNITLLPGGRLTSNSLDKQTASCLSWRGWGDPCLKFISFEDGVLSLRNSSGDDSRMLRLQVRQDTLLVACDCGHDNKIICKHASRALNRIHWHFHENYFTKLVSGGMMELAFRYPILFNKQETNQGLNVELRAELKSVYHLGPAIATPDLNAITRLPGTNIQTTKELPAINYKAAYLPNGKAIAYLIILPVHFEHLPSVIPLTGTATVRKNAIKTFDGFLNGLQKITDRILAREQKELHQKCLKLYQLTEKLKGRLLADHLFTKHLRTLTLIFDLWTETYRLLLAQPFIYRYVLYGKKELLGRPRKQHCVPVLLSDVIPQLSFELADKGDHYRFSLLIHAEDELLKGANTQIPFFIFVDQECLLRVGSLRDACILEWFDRSGGWISVFKEHFEQFEKEILLPLKACYPVTFC
jgi:hypothetical protein